MNITTRLANQEDAVLIADLSHKTFYDTFAQHNTAANMNKFLYEQFTRGKLILEVSDPKNIFLLAYEGPQVVGYVKLRDDKKPASLKSNNVIEIARLYSVKEMIGKGVGKILMEESLDLALKRQKEVAWLGVWEKNRRAIEFYEKWGFDKFGEIEFLLGDDLQCDWLMRKWLV